MSGNSYKTCRVQVERIKLSKKVLCRFAIINEKLIKEDRRIVGCLFSYELVDLF